MHTWLEKMADIAEKKQTPLAEVEESTLNREVHQKSASYKLLVRCINRYNAETFLLPNGTCQSSYGSLANKLLI